jgi:hypothetical protein
VVGYRCRGVKGVKQRKSLFYLKTKSSGTGQSEGQLLKKMLCSVKKLKDNIFAASFNNPKKLSCFATSRTHQGEGRFSCPTLRLELKYLKKKTPT